jgi:hypothetical protein
LPYGAYTFESTVAGGVFEEYLPYTTSGQFTLESENLGISLTATTDYGLVSVKNQSVSEAKVTAGSTSKSLNVLDDNTYFYIYVKASTQIELAITETDTGTTITRDIDVIDSKHYNYIIDLNKGNLNLIDLVLNPFGYEEEVISSLDGDTKTGSLKFIEENGTIKCPNTIPGEKGIVNGKTYESVDRDLLIQRRDEGADLTCVCTTLVTDMNGIFLQKPFNQAIGNWDVSNVTNMSNMFNGSTFNQGISKWNVSKVSSMSAMFQKTNFNQAIGDWNVSNVTNFSLMFKESSFNQPIGNWNVSKANNMQEMFYGTTFNQAIANWNVSNVTTMSGMFRETNFNHPIGEWNVSNVINMYQMFLRGAFNQSLANWTVTSVNNMQEMFLESQFNQPIRTWNVANVRNMARMFLEARNFNQNISNWCVTNITSEPVDFSLKSALSSENKPVWGTCPN